VSFPFYLQSATVFDLLMPSRALAAPVPCNDNALLKATSKGHGRTGMESLWAWHDMYELTSAVQRRHVGNLPAFGFFRLPRGVP
jgi:hypothetical protein